MKAITITMMFLLILGGQALGFGLVLQRAGHLALDPDNLHETDSFDFDGNGNPDLIEKDETTFRVWNLAGAVLWSVTIDTLEVCPECTGPGGFWGMYFEGFFEIEPGHRDALIEYQYDNWDMGTSTRGILVVSTADGSTRYQLSGLGLEAAVDLDGDGIHELACWRDNGSSPWTWEIWGNQTPITVPDVTTSALRVDQNRPNPFNPATKVRFELAEAGPTRVEIHDAAGRLVYDRPLGELPAGSHDFTWNGTDRRGRRVASGTYFFTVVAGTQRAARKMMLIK